jgi:hypothetical protein
MVSGRGEVSVRVMYVTPRYGCVVITLPRADIDAQTSSDRINQRVKRDFLTERSFKNLARAGPIDRPGKDHVSTFTRATGAWCDYFRFLFRRIAMAPSDSRLIVAGSGVWDTTTLSRPRM